MAKTQRETFAFIKKFKTAGQKRREKYLKLATPEEIHSLCECTLNICNGNVPISRHTLNRLKPYKRAVKHISFGNVKNRKKYLIQHGGFLPLIASAILPVVGAVIGKLIE